MATTSASRLTMTLARWLVKIGWFLGLLYIGLRIISPEKFISLYTSERFAQWVHGYSSQENFDDLWVLTWVVSSLAFAVVGYLLSMWIIRKVRR
ncbi:hypothetical protein [Pluralibacter sp.]|jgi:hypothetical protein|uniref:hypothetical protein n=1 Tax=Pluralibacter sp. TaxID=1920032 RepID=UPI0025F7DC31|nr:hypothetical protein [Pluralibacter sp.]MBV8042581.1 hypothetical protein [Pluralibacter sp.]